MAPESLISSLAPEILGEIMLYVTGEELGRLKLTGSKILWVKLCDKRGVKSVWMPNDELQLHCIPAFLSELNGLDELDFYYEDESDWVMEGLKLRFMPKTLRKLVMTGWSPKMGDGLLQGEVKLSDHMPHLEDLEYRADWTKNASWLSGIPDKMKRLGIGGWDPSVPLPSSLTKFYFMKMLPCTEESFILPPHLTQLESLGFCSNLPALIASLPESLTYLSIARSSDNVFSLENISKLPRGLQNLRISFASNLELLRPISDVESAWPPALKKLAIDRFPLDYWAALPRNLEAFEYLVPHSVFTKSSSFKGDSFEQAWGSLPSTLTYLSIELYDLTLMPSKFPKFPFLRSLIIPKCYFMLSDDSMLENLFSPTLIELEIANLTGKMAKYLPKGLQQLKVSHGFMSSDLIKYLPQSLREMHITLTESTDQVFDPKTKELVRLSKLSTSPHRFEHEKLWEEGSAYALPPYIQEMTLDGKMELDDGLFQNLPKMMINLNLSGIAFSSFGFESMAAYQWLEILDMGSCDALTGEYFQFLPNSLTELVVKKVVEIEDEHIQHLPRSLITFKASYAAYLSNECLESLPPRLSLFEAQENEYILPEDLPLFPFKFQEGSEFYHFFRNSKFTIDCGDLRRGKIYGGI